MARNPIDVNIKEVINIPTYVYQCSTCSHVFDTMESIGRRNNPQTCPKCEGLGYRDVEHELQCNSRAKWVTDNERWSVSMGVPLASLADYRKQFPNSVYDNNGRLLIRDRKDKLRQMRERSMVELDNNHIGKR